MEDDAERAGGADVARYQADLRAERDGVAPYQSLASAERDPHWRRSFAG